MAVQKYEIVVKKLLLDIFNNKIKAGAKLPTERQLSVDLGVDRTSLRVALKQLESMQVLDIRQGDGIYVRDYRKYAGVDFLRMLFFQQEEHGDEIIVDSYLIEEVWSFWAEFMPLMIRMAMKRISPMEIKQFMNIFDEELENLDDKERIVQLEVLSQDLVAEKCGNLVMLLVSNSTRQMRTKVVRLFVDMIDTPVLKEHVEFKRALLRGYQTGELTDPDIFPNEHKKLLHLHQGLIKKLWPISEKERTLVQNVLKTDR
ncbi:MAG: GntR family transcriptional regulator [Proteobacteria bacterium]|nr:GntR family transcriptional regulator [Pseudomonadota bacterium]